MQDMKVSVIVPFYNVEQYLEQCLEHLRKQTLDGIEVIMVNDGSTDSSRKIAQTYQERYDGFVLCDRENGGASAARNTGIAQARGKYILFCDSDDFLGESAVEYLYNAAEKEGLELLHFEMTSFKEGDRADERIKKVDVSKSRMKSYYDRIMTGKECLNEMLKTDVLPSPCVMFLRRGCLERSQIAFREGIMFEDMLFQFELYMKLERVKNIPEVFYYRRFRQGSVMSDATTTARRFWSLAECLCAMCDVYGKNDLEVYPYIDRYPQFVFSQSMEQMSLLIGQRGFGKEDKEKYMDIAKAIGTYTGKKTAKMRWVRRMPLLYLICCRCKKGICHG